MKQLAAGYIGAALCMLVLDAIWLSTMARILYRPQIGELLLDGVRYGPAIAFYLIYVAGIVYFAVHPAAERASLGTALMNGAVLGFVAYATYDLTNQATMKVWSTTVTLADIAWGTLLTAASATAGYYAARWAA